MEKPLISSTTSMVMFPAHLLSLLSPQPRTALPIATSRNLFPARRRGQDPRDGPVAIGDY